VRFVGQPTDAVIGARPRNEAGRRRNTAGAAPLEGFSCREPIDPGSDLRTRHVTEVIADALF
jgi:hypothetical protein